MVTEKRYDKFQGTVTDEKENVWLFGPEHFTMHRDGGKSCEDERIQGRGAGDPRILQHW